MMILNINTSAFLQIFCVLHASAFYCMFTVSVKWMKTKQIDGAYTRLLRSALNVSWRDHITNLRLYGSLPKVTSKIKVRRMRLAGHCHRHDDEIASMLVLWQPDSGQANRGKRRTTLVDTLLDDTGCTTTGELSNLMMDRDGWKARIHEVRAGARQR